MRPRRFTVTLTALLLLGGAACAQRSDQIRTARPVAVGMTTQEVIAQWGKPRHVQQLQTPQGRTEVWYYPDGVYPISVPYGRVGAAPQKFLSLYVRDGRVVAVDRLQ